MAVQLQRITDPEAVNDRAFADQARMIEAMGAIDAIRALPGFSQTPIEAS